ncbi:phosphoenolpyruvate--protein phosphotransferase [Halococcus sediminicola]|uniref:phosphoenolpyruvate--protein phosphotransferase n=1 Tax=Halococcus sediminicola TaxID=1264579 RepID=UPI000678F8D8|nr:phosphoenolpyruvate--protein phosphotransferase [Halococcus sediminicola]
MSDHTLTGIGATPLSAVGSVVWYRPDENVELPAQPPADTVDPETERERFTEAQERAREELETERDRAAERVGADEAAVFDAHSQFLGDPQIEGAIVGEIDEGLPAEHAVQNGFESGIEQFEGMDGRMADRADDLRDVRDRLVRILTDTDRTDLSDLPRESIVFAERLTPSDTAHLDPDTVAGFVTVTGGRTSHASIFARSLALSAVVGVGDGLNAIDEGTTVAIDGEAGTVIPEPSDEIREQATRTARAAIRSEPVTTADGTAIEVAANVGRPSEIEAAIDRGADGIGLYRTEFLFLDREAPPGEDEQYEIYREALASFPDGRVVVRTLDIGGDKPIPYLDLPSEDNPFLGERGIRRSLDADSELFETQLRALVRAAIETTGDLAIMFPLVATLDEFETGRERVETVIADLEADGQSIETPEVGTMIETPATVFLAPDLAARADFLSIGTNDLTQYVMAADRGNERVGDLHDPRHPAVLRALRRTIEATEGMETWIGMCGEMAGDPELTELLVGLGLDELSMSALTVPEVKARIGEIDSSMARTLAERALAASTKREVDDILAEGARGTDR